MKKVCLYFHCPYNYCFRVLLSLYPESGTCMENMQHNLTCWRKAIPYFENQYKDGKTAIEILSDSCLDDILLWSLEE